MSGTHPLGTQRPSLMVDASALIALFNPADQYHRQAVIFRDNFILRFNIKLFTTDYIYSEAMSHLTCLPSEVLQRLDALIRTSATRDPLRIKELWVSKATIEKAVPIFLKYLDQDFSITDCTSFVLMEEHGIHSAFTFDDDYRIYTYRKGHETSRRGFWKLPEMLEEYMADQSLHAILPL